MIYIVLPLAIILAAIALGAFLWAVKRGQFDDLDSPAIRAVFDDEEEGKTENRKSEKAENSEDTRELRLP